MSGEGSLFDVPPAAIGRFRVLHQVGAGTSGPVFRAVHPETDAPLAIKLFTLDVAPERAALIVDELDRLVARMPEVDGICDAIDAGLHGTMPFLVTSFAPGDSLDVALKQFGPAALIDLVPRLRTLARALDAAAGRDVLHGALHPRDVLVSEGDTAVTGLGTWPILAKFGERVPLRRPYRAPELSDTAVSAEGDRFSLAAITYEWMTGRRPPLAFVAGDMAAVPGADREALARVFARALRADPAERYPSCAAFVDALAEVPVEEVGTPVPAGDARASESRRRRNGRIDQPPARLPLETFPTEDADLSLAPGGEDDDRPGPALGVGFAAEESAIPLATSLNLRPSSAEPTLQPVTRGGVFDAGAAAQPPAGRGWRLAVGLLLGTALGVGAGYAVWGRDGGPLLPGAFVSEPGGAAEGASQPASTGAPDSTAPESPAAAGAPGTGPDATPSPQPPAAGAKAGSGAGPAPADPGAAATAPAPAASAGTGVPLPVAPTAAGNLLVRSTPAGATVFVDDQRRGVTPLALQNVELGTRRVRVQRDGFAAEERQITLTSSRPSRSVDVRLTRATSAARPSTPAPATPSARTGSLVIESRPTGATIVLNGRQIGTTPMTIDDLEPGTYSVRLQLDTYRPITTNVRVVAGARARAAASLSALEPQ